MRGEHVYTLEKLGRRRLTIVHVPRMQSSADASLDVTEGLKEVIARIQGEEEPPTAADPLNIGRLHYSAYNVLVEWGSFGGTIHAAPGFLEGKLRYMGSSLAVKLNWRRSQGVDGQLSGFMFGGRY